MTKIKGINSIEVAAKRILPAIQCCLNSSVILIPDISAICQLSDKHPMQITLNLDESLLNEAFQLTNLTSQEELMNLALQELVRSRRQKNLLDLAGQIQFSEDFDHKALL